jgi:hypothetical protein
MKPTRLEPLRPSRRLFSRTTPGLLDTGMTFSAVVAVIGTLGLLASIIWS